MYNELKSTKSVLNYRLFSLLFVISIPGTFSMRHNLLELQDTVCTLIPSAFAPWIVLLLTVFAIWIGQKTYKSLGVNLSFFEGISENRFKETWKEKIQPHIRNIVSWSIVAVVIFLFFVEGLGPHIVDKNALECARSGRRSFGIAARFLFGGIQEEILFRFGLFLGVSSLLRCIFKLRYALILGMILSGIIFGILHLPTLVNAQVYISLPTIIFVIFLGLFVSTIACLFLINYGLFASMFFHLMLHAGWLLFDGL